eukprot:GHVR01095228.1.p1 GENE.GHVR01095228.1~~GHVR01095228.1.p1  ORF type:complete len:108 (-),score=2.01 GHVR01095228.1:87-410(-)
MNQCPPQPDASPKMKSPIRNTPLSGGNASKLFDLFVKQKEDIHCFQDQFKLVLNKDEIQLQADLRNILSYGERPFQAGVSEVLKKWSEPVVQQTILSCTMNTSLNQA